MTKAEGEILDDLLIQTISKHSELLRLHTKALHEMHEACKALEAAIKIIHLRLDLSDQFIKFYIRKENEALALLKEI